MRAAGARGGAGGAPLTHPDRPARLARAVLAFCGALAAFVLYVELRKRWFPSPLPAELAEALPEGASRLKRLSHDFLVWFHQAPLPKDPLNNPLADAEAPQRIAGALRVYWRGLTQIVFPKTLSRRLLVSRRSRLRTGPAGVPESVLGAAMMVLPLLGALVLWILAWSRESAARARAALIVTQPQETRDSLAEYGAAWASVAAMPQASLTRSSLYGPVRPTARWVRPLGAALLGIAVGAAVLDFFVLRPRGQVVAWRSLPLWLMVAPVGASAWAGRRGGARMRPAGGERARAVRIAGRRWWRWGCLERRRLPALEHPVCCRRCGRSGSGTSGIGSAWCWPVFAWMWSARRERRGGGSADHRPVPGFQGGGVPDPMD